MSTDSHSLMQLFILDQKVAEIPYVDPVGISQFSEIRKILSWFNKRIGWLAQETAEAHPPENAYSIFLYLNTPNTRNLKPNENQLNLYLEFKTKLEDYYEEIKGIAESPYAFAQDILHQHPEMDDMRKEAKNKLEKLRKLSGLDLADGSQDRKCLRIKIGTLNSSTLEIQLEDPKEFSHAIELLSADEEQPREKVSGKAAAVYSSYGLCVLEIGDREYFLNASRSILSKLNVGETVELEIFSQSKEIKVSGYRISELLSTNNMTIGMASQA